MKFERIRKLIITLSATSLTFDEQNEKLADEKFIVSCEVYDRGECPSLLVTRQ